MEVAEVRRERIQTVKDVSGVEDRGVASFGLFGEEREEAGPDEDVEVDGDLQGRGEV